MKMEPVVFLSTSPTFMLIQNGLAVELNSNGLVHLEGQNTVSTQSLVKGNVHSPYSFETWYNFSRTASSTLRLFMLEASGMRNLYNPLFRSRDANVASWEVLKEPQDYSIQMAGHGAGAIARARLFASDFDRLFPHCVIEQKLDGIVVGAQGSRTLSGLMYVIDFDERLIYYTNASMNVTLEDDNNPKIIKASITVAVTENSYDEPTNEALPLCPRYSLVKNLVDEWNPNQQPGADNLHDSLAGLTLNPNPEN